jgi:hypothetical protein
MFHKSEELPLRPTYIVMLAKVLLQANQLLYFGATANQLTSTSIRCVELCGSAVSARDGKLGQSAIAVPESIQPGARCFSHIEILVFISKLLHRAGYTAKTLRKYNSRVLVGLHRLRTPDLSYFGYITRYYIIVHCVLPNMFYCT